MKSKIYRWVSDIQNNMVKFTPKEVPLFEHFKTFEVKGNIHDNPELLK